MVRGTQRGLDYESKWATLTFEVRWYIDAVKAGHSHPMLIRVLAVAAALAVAAQGGGMPMCVSLLAEATTPCAMHTHTAPPAQSAHVAMVSAAPSGHGACHAAAANLGCANGGACPINGTAAPVWAKVSAAPPAASRTEILGPASALKSYLAPPLSPPPQA
jgi:hypothetical protein